MVDLVQRNTTGVRSFFSHQTGVILLIEQRASATADPPSLQ